MAIRASKDCFNKWSTHEGDVQSVLPTLPANLFDAAFADPPYGISFMNHGWDADVPPASVWKSLLDLCKPGAYLLAFGGTKTFHRLACGIEDAGWEIRDTIMWLYGQGFPKGHNISAAIDKERRRSDKLNPNRSPSRSESTAWDGYNTALKPAWEPILLAQKPLQGTFAKNALKHGCGGLNIPGCRIGSRGGTKRSHQAAYPRVDGREDRRNWARSGHSVEHLDQGRWPANLILDDKAAQDLDLQSGRSRSSRARRRLAESSIGNGKTMNSFSSEVDVIHGYDDEGGASRFFYIAKANPKERDGNDHPTIKPITLCEYLARLVLPPERKTPRRLIIPFSGSGSEMLGGLMAGWDHVTGVERDPDYMAIAQRRLRDYSKRSA